MNKIPFKRVNFNWHIPREMFYGFTILAVISVGSYKSDHPVQGLSIIRNVTIINPAKEEILPSIDVSYMDNKIVEIAEDIDAIGENEIDGVGKFLMPGLIDAHVHIRDTSNLKLFLYYGVTTVRDMGGQIGEPLKWRAGIEKGELIGPEIISASPIISDADSNLYSFPRSTEHLEHMISEYATQGYDWIKTFRLRSDLYRELAITAKASDIPFGGHLPFADSAETSFTIYDLIRSGVKSIEHIDELANLFKAASDNEVLTLADSLIKYDVSVVTITWQDRLIAGLIEPSLKLDIEKLDSIVLYFSGETGLSRFKGQSEFLKTNAPLSARNLLEIVPHHTRRLLNILNQKGVRLVLGTDTHNGPNVSGLGVHNELNSLVEYGLKPMDVLRFVTSNAAELLARKDIGEISEGFQADFLLLNQNPLESLQVLMNIERLCMNGKWYDKRILQNYLSDYRSQ